MFDEGVGYSRECELKQMQQLGIFFAWNTCWHQLAYPQSVFSWRPRFSETSDPRRSMGLPYLPTLRGSMYRHIWQSHGVYGYVMFPSTFGQSRQHLEPVWIQGRSVTCSSSISVPRPCGLGRRA